MTLNQVIMFLALLKTFTLAMTPIGELRAAIPYGLFTGLNPVLVYLTAVAGNMVPVFFLLKILPYLEKAANVKISPQVNKPSLKNKFINIYLWFKNRTHRKYNQRFARLGALALITFVAIPLPVTGAWTGSLAAYIFNVPVKKAIPLILAGVMIAGAIVSLITMPIRGKYMIY